MQAPSMPRYSTSPSLGGQLAGCSGMGCSGSRVRMQHLVAAQAAGGQGEAGPPGEAVRVSRLGICNQGSSFHVP